MGEVRKFFKLSTFAALCALVACGGGGGSSASLETQPLTVTGIAATGAPMASATLQIYGKDGTAVLANPVTIANDGSYSATIPATATGPFVFEVDNGSEKVYSVLPNKSSTPVVHVTPISNLIAAKLSATGSPFNLASEIAAASTTVTTTAVTTATTSVMTALQPLATALNLDSAINPISTPFSANGSGFDRMLDSLDVKIEPKGSASQIEVTLKQAVDESQDLPKIAFAHNATPSALPTVDSNKLVASGLTPKIQALLDKLTACYSDPLSSRITAGGTTAAAIQSQNCKDAFIGGNPAGYKSGGMVIAKTQHFGGIFTAEATAGVSFSDPKYFYTVGSTVANGPTSGDIVFGFRWKDEYGNFNIEKNVGRIDTDGKLKLIGNQYQYDIGVGAYSQRRNYLNQPASTFNSVGYSFGLSCYQLNQSQGVGNKIVKVNVTSPGGRKMTFIPNLSNGNCNYSYFVIALPKDKTGTATVDGMGDPSYATGTGFVRLQSFYEAGETTAANHPRKLDKNIAFIGGFDGTDLTNAEIEAIPQFGTWTFEYFKTKTAGSTPVATQYFKTTSRSLTVDGFKKTVKLPEITADLKTSLTSNTICGNNSVYCFVKQATGPFVATWSKPTDPGLVPATYLARVYGIKDITVTPTTSWVGYEDSIKFGSSRTTASIRCGQGETAVQPYCSGTSPATADFGTNVSIDALDLVSRAPDGTDVSHFHTLKKLQ